jgi:hypothetical protein
VVLKKKSPVQWLFAVRKTSIRCGPLFSGSAPSPAWCIRTGCPYQKTYIACNCAVQPHNLDTWPAGQHPQAGWPRRRRIARQNAVPAWSEFEARTFQASSAVAVFPVHRRRSPYSPVVYTSCPSQDLYAEFGNVFKDPNYFYDRTLHTQNQQDYCGTIGRLPYGNAKCFSPPGINKGISYREARDRIQTTVEKFIPPLRWAIKCG